MPQHRETSSSVSVQDLLGDISAASGAAERRTRHRAQPRTGDRMKLAASAAVATGALISTATQFAHAAPLLPGGHNDTPEPVALKSASEPAHEAEQAAPVAAPIAAETPAAPQAQPVAAPAPAPFGLQNLPPEVAGPLSHAEEVLKGIQQQLAPAQAVRPVAGVVSSGFGSRWGAMHYGVDFADSIGTPIHSVENGTVIDAGPASGFGLWVRVKQDDGTTAVYGHVNDILTHVGQRVNAGDVIATVGNRGNSTGPHLHLEIWDPSDVKIDPAPYLASKGVVLSQQSWGAGE
ncbi:MULTISPECIES: M23 family metallopeptidase [Nocardia]|uniref:M23 family metallopeptidase n=1 Tax=Nocardia TaxID=1817 RepID=UPI0002E39207|nr:MULTISPECIES: M23 family metallopeptidase [Nocardia]